MSADNHLGPAARVGAIVLAAGQSSRLGRSKQLLKIEGHSLVRRATKAAIDAGCSQVVIVTGANAEAVAAEVRCLRATVQFNRQWATGMGTSIRCGVASLAEADLEAILIAPCDQPRLSSGILNSLICTWKSSEKPMAACKYADTLGIPCCFSKSMLPALLALSDSDGAKQLLQLDLANVATLPWPDGAIDIDTPEDWRRLAPDSL